jgi:hypothetical protein
MIKVERIKPMEIKYEAPKIITYSEDEIIEMLGVGTNLLTEPMPNVSIK